jgi:CHAT domain-containing protein
LKSSRFILILFLSLAMLPLGGSLDHGAARRDASRRLFTGRLQEVRGLWNQGRCAEAIPRLRRAAIDARKAGEPKFHRVFLDGLGACLLTTFQSQEALKAFLESRELSIEAGHLDEIVRLDLNISSAYSQAGNREDSAVAAEQGLALAKVVKPPSKTAVEQLHGYVAKLLIQLASLRARSRSLEAAEPVFAEAIDAAYQANDLETAAWAWDYLAFERRKGGRLSAAESAATEGFRLRKLLHLPAIESSYRNLGAIRAALGDTRAGIALLDEAERALHRNTSRTPSWRIYMERGHVKLDAGHLQSALDDLRTALGLARIWRVDVVANDASRISSEGEGNLGDLYSLLIEAGNRLYLEEHDPALVRETFEAAEENRAASLRALVPQPDDWRRRLPPKYWDLLAGLQSAESHWLRAGEKNAPAAVLKLRSQLAEVEAGAGAPAQGKAEHAWDIAREALDADSTLFSFQIGETRSWVWAVTRDGISLHTAPSRAELAAQIGKLEAAASQNSDLPVPEAATLYQALFGSIEAGAVSRRRWLLALDGKELFDLPFPALRDVSGQPLIFSHSLQIVPAALMLKRTKGQPAYRGAFLGVGDPIYNAADNRAKPLARPVWPPLLRRASFESPSSNRSSNASSSAPSFARLWGTGREVQAAAREWQGSASLLLTGQNASKARFWSAVASKPTIIHLATHILEEEDRHRTGWIALSLGANGQPEYLSPEEILARSVGAELVVLSGCSSGKAEVRTASGLMGLTRAWLAAGAGAVLATRWPTVDDDGIFFESFYRNLRQSTQEGPAEALRKASIEMAESGTWRAQSSFWSGYFLVGNN